MKNRIDEIDIIKGILILFVISTHAAGFSGLKGLYPTMTHFSSAFGLIAMVSFYMLTGYTYNQGNKTIVQAIGKRIKAILLPYYTYCVPMIAVLFILFIPIEHRTIGWFVDGVIAIIFQLQSTYIFSNGTSVHEMMYSVFACWFIFQLLAAFLVFVPVYHLVENKKLYVKIATALVLLGIGAVLYHLNIQKLNGEFFPPVCKMFVLPNIFGISGLLMIGKCASIVNLLDIGNQCKSKRVIYSTVSLAIVAIGIATDDYMYDFPIGKWGAFGEISYFITSIYGIALIVLLGNISYVIKRNKTVKNTLLFFGENTLDFLLLHFFIVWFVSYIGGFWAPAQSSVVISEFDAAEIWIHFLITMSVTLVINSVVVILKTNLNLRRCVE